jgi:hypothetical protein
MEERGENTVKNQKENTMKKIRRLYRIVAMVGAILLPIGVVLATGIPEASALSGSQFCVVNSNGGEMCLNAWGGGPWVKVETTYDSRIQNNRFQIRYENNGNVELQFVGGGAWNGQCVGDAYNDPTYASTSLNPCGDINNGNGSGWGTQLQLQQWGPGGPCLTNQVAFYDWHWHGYLGPTSPTAANGSLWYLNKPSSTPICFFTS